TNNFDYCINCAAFTNVEQAEKTPEIAFKINAKAVKHLAQICKVTNTILIHISTDYVFDGSKNEPYTELDIPNPINEYGKSKLLGEQYIQQILNNYFIIRTSWLYSKDFGHNFYRTITKKIKDKQKLKITTSQTGTPTNCTALSKFILFLIETHQKDFGVYHFSALGKATWYDFAIEISKQYKQASILPVTSLQVIESKVNRPQYSVLNNQKAQGIYPLIKNWQEALNLRSNSGY
ncbi:MAG: dTDP-4-dehydrorhamnose reductase, partial [Bacteroidetes bacterium]|nr:dTDP-4-dehydrorhamnose reductase [Bacteroidota bacterium]